MIDAIPPTALPAAAPPPADAIDVAPGVKVSAGMMRFQFARSRGPGGQNVNKVNTKAELWAPLAAIWGLTPRAMSRLRGLAGKRLTAEGEVHIAADSERSQEQNRRAAIDRFTAMIRAAIIEPKARRKTKPSKAAKRRRLESKRRRSDVKSNRRAGGDF